MSDIFNAKSETGHDLPAFMTPDGRIRLLGAIPGPISRKATAWSSVNLTIPRSDWSTFERHRPDVPDLDQSQEGSCVAHGSDSMIMRARSKAGESPILLARAFLYALINGGRDAGANPDDAMTALQEVGICTEETVPYRFLVKSQLSQASYEEAKRFRLDPTGVYSLDNFDEMVSAEILGFSCGYTIYVAGNWNNLDADGCPPAYRGTGNHWMSCDDGLYQNSRGEWLLDVRQSWGTQWGNKGRARVREAHFANQPGMQMWAIKYPGQDPNDPNLVPVAL